MNFIARRSQIAIRCLYSTASLTGLRWAVWVLLVPVLGVLLGCSSSPGPSGQEIFAANCAVCHGPEGQGQPGWHIPKGDGTLPPPPLNGDGHTWHHPDGFLYRYVSGGGRMLEGSGLPGFKTAMPAFGETLTHDEIIAVLEYVKSMWGDKTSRGLSIRESQAHISERDPYPPR